MALAMDYWRLLDLDRGIGADYLDIMDAFAVLVLGVGVLVFVGAACDT